MQLPKPSLKVILPVIVVVFTVVIVGGLIATKPQAVSKQIEEKIWQVRSVQVELAQSAPVLPLVGKVVSPSHVTLTSAVEADVIAVHVVQGQFISKGSPLVQLDQREAKQRLVQRQGELDEVDGLINAEQARYENDQAALRHEKTLLDLSSKTADRLRKLAQQDLGARSQLDEALQSEARQQLAVQTRSFQISEHTSRLEQFKARHKQAKARYELAALELQRTQILAPVDAYITTRHIAPGQRVRIGEALLGVYDVNQVEIIAQLPWVRYDELNEFLGQGKELDAVLQVGDSRTSLKLTRLAAQVTEGKGGIDATFSASDGLLQLPLGKVVSFDLTLPTVEASFVMPYEGLYGLDKIYRIVDERLQATTIRVLGEAGITAGVRYVLIQGDGIATGDQVLVTKFANAMDGLRVRVTP